VFWNLINGPEFRPKFYLSGMPKAGLHLLSMTVQGICEPLRDYFGVEWNGTHGWYSWTLRQENDIRRVKYRLGQVAPGQYVMGHVAYYPDLERLCDEIGVAHVMIYRDLRDVAVSQAHHVTSENDKRFIHPAKDLYRAMGNFDEVLAAVIEGVGPFGGVLERWPVYAPWLDSETTLCIRYEDARADLETAARAILKHGLSAIYPLQHTMRVKIEGELFDKEIEKMVTTGGEPRISPTFRAGRCGDWRDAFKERHRDLWKENDPEHWLVRLGYESTEDW